MGNRTSGRKEVFALLREGSSHLTPYTDEYGNQTMLNLTKHFIYQRPYKKDVYNRELLNVAQKFNEYMKNKAKEGKETASEVVAEVIK